MASNIPFLPKLTVNAEPIEPTACRANVPSNKLINKTKICWLSIPNNKQLKQAITLNIKPELSQCANIFARMITDKERPETIYCSTLPSE